MIRENLFNIFLKCKLTKNKINKTFSCCRKYKIPSNANFKLVLNVHNSETTPGTKLTLFDDLGTKNQQWYFSNNCVLHSELNGELALDVSDGIVWLFVQIEAFVNMICLNTIKLFCKILSLCTRSTIWLILTE